MCQCTTELWAPIPGFEGSYEVSTCGRVRSLDRVITFRDGRSRFAPGTTPRRDHREPWVFHGISGEIPR